MRPPDWILGVLRDLWGGAHRDGVRIRDWRGRGDWGRGFVWDDVQAYS